MDELTLKLTGKELDIVANALGQRPYVEVAQLLQKIGQQIQAQQQQPQIAVPAEAKTNGATHQQEMTP